MQPCILEKKLLHCIQYKQNILFLVLIVCCFRLDVDLGLKNYLVLISKHVVSTTSLHDTYFNNIS